MPQIAMSRQPFFRWSLIIAIAATLVACGFHLRGPVNLPFKSIYLGSATGTPLGVELKRNIESSGNTIVAAKEKDAEAIMEVLSQTQEKVILMLNGQGQAREYVLYSKFRFRLKDAQQKELMAPTQITLKRDISYNSTEELSKVGEEALLYRDMQTDLVQQILRRLAALKPANADSNPVTEPAAPTPSVPSQKPAQ